jgi:hypothetical protein
VARKALSTVGVRFALAGVPLVALVIVLQGPISRMHARSLRAAAIVKGDEIADDEVILYLPRARSLHYASLGNDGLAADYVWTKSANYVGREFAEEHKEKKFKWLKKLYDTVASLDPHWENAHSVGAMLLSTVGDDVAASLELVDRGIAANHDSWRLPYTGGVICLLAPGRAGDAARYLAMAARRPGHPRFIDDILPVVTEASGRLRVAVGIARASAIRHAGTPLGEAYREPLIMLVTRLLESELNAGARAFREKTGRPPARLGELRAAGTLDAFDLAWAEAIVIFEEDHGRLIDAVRASGVEVAPDGGRLEVMWWIAKKDVKKHVKKGVKEETMLDRLVRSGRFPPPERADPFGGRWLYHAPTGTVRSWANACVTIRRKSSVLNAASKHYVRKRGSPAPTLDALARYYYDEHIVPRKSLDVEWTDLFKDGRPPEHPLAAWGERWPYDCRTGRTIVPERYMGIGLDPLPPGELDWLPLDADQGGADVGLHGVP